MLGDYGRIIKLTESIIGATVSNSAGRQGIVLEHIFEHACVVRWMILNKTDVTIEFISDLKIINIGKE